MTRIRSESDRISSSSNETSRIAAALVALLDEPAVHELDRPDVEAPVGCAATSTLDRARPRARHDLLLVAAGQRAATSVGPPPRTSNSCSRLAGALDQPPRVEPAELRVGLFR